MSGQAVIHWFRKDLRLGDNPALHEACASAGRLLPVYCHDPAEDAATPWGFVRRGLHRRAFLAPWLSNRMCQVVASYLIHDLGCDWRAGAAWFEAQLVDYDVYSNQGNWLYIAGRGTDPRGGRRFDPDKQAASYDADGAYRGLWAERDRRAGD
jgi:deoxyribodipyrimidine photo-lyase